MSCPKTGRWEDTMLSAMSACSLISANKQVSCEQSSRNMMEYGPKIWSEDMINTFIHASFAFLLSFPSTPRTPNGSTPPFAAWT